ncbi:MAG: septation protein A [Pseudorhodoplanes sp.]|jgi:intracellular septation protein|nr:septation protein A [Pseudorhodoplanes sp.]
MSEKTQLNPFAKLALDLGPLILFFYANSRPGLFLPLVRPFFPAIAADAERSGIFVATAVFMVAVVVSLIVSYALIRRLPLMPVVSAIIVVVFGGLTLFLHNDTFIKMKPTIIYVLFGAVLLGGLILKKPLLETVFDSVFHLSEEGWRILTIRWSAFFFVMAILNEIVWRMASTDTWVTFKVFGVMPLTFVFAMLQYPVLTKYAVEPEKK